MSKLGVICLVVLSLALDAAAAFKLSKSVYRINNLEDATTEAESKGKAITFIYTDENSTCGLCDCASLNLIDQLDKKTVVVYADCSKDFALLPLAVQNALSQPAAGRFIPKTIIVDAGMTNVLAVLPYALGNEQNQLLKDAKKKLPDTRLKSSLSMKTARLTSASAFTVPPDETREVRRWTSKSKVTS